MNTPDPSWRPTSNLEILRQRSELLRTLREYFHAAGFVEVHTPLLSRDTVIDRYLDPIQVPGKSLDLGEAAETYYLQTSPEFGMKRLLAAGMQAIYQIAPAFRAGEFGGQHNPEFTMLEWYRTGDDMRAGVNFLSQLVQRALGQSEVEVCTYREVFCELVGCDPLTSRLSDLAATALSHGIQVARDWSEERDDWLNLLFAEVVQPSLGCQRPLIVTHYPASQSALARACPEDPRTAERYELFVHGVELANGYHELLDPEELANRNARVSEQRRRDGKPALPADSRLLAAMQNGLPQCSGCALGFDRLLMVLTGVNDIQQVIAFPFDRA